ncbi:hypothetical protein N7507_007438 [Penicillium longicatenatum]|nr:hypothetical protein N7507_007438 [Penicillium longicatenatum]
MPVLGGVLSTQSTISAWAQLTALPHLLALQVLLDEARCSFRECIHSGLRIRCAYKRNSTRINNPQSFDTIYPQIGIHHSVSLTR